MLLKDARQMRWHSMMIKWCMNLRMLSSCYNALRSFNSSFWTHIAWLHTHRNLDTRCRWAVDQGAKLGEVPEHQKYVALIFDEVKIKEDLVYNKYLGELVGFVDITDIKQHLTALQQSCLGEIPTHQLATHMLVFMVGISICTIPCSHCIGRSVISYCMALRWTPWDDWIQGISSGMQWCFSQQEILQNQWQ